MSKRGVIFFVALIVVSLMFSLLFVYSDNVDDFGDQSGCVMVKDGEWVAEWYDENNFKIRKAVKSKINFDDDDNDFLFNKEEMIWGLDPKSGDTDSDKLTDGYNRHFFVDECPKQYNDYCDQKRSMYWKSIMCDKEDECLRKMGESYLSRIKLLSSVFNDKDKREIVPIYHLFSEWSYDDSNTDLSDVWVELGYDDSSWKKGDAYLGYGEASLNTQLSYGDDEKNKIPTYYFRKSFYVDKNYIDNLELFIDYDDGIIAYINGKMVGQTGKTKPNHFSYTNYHEASIGDNHYKWFSYKVEGQEFEDLIIDGENIVAVELHQTTKHSSDIVFGSYMLSYKDVLKKGLVDSYDDMCLVLESKGSIEEKLRQQLFTLWLNVISGEICVKQKVDAECFNNEGHNDNNVIENIDIEELIGYSEYILIEGRENEYNDIYEVLLLLNQGFCCDCFRAD